MSDLEIVWFFLIGAILAVYVVLDGYDLGVGFWHLIIRDKGTRRILRASISPYWDGNEVWLITGGALLFAAFPAVYAAIFSGLYVFIVLITFALILRAVSIEFVGQHPSAWWTAIWEAAFGLGSTAAGFGFALAAGNIIRGLPLDNTGNPTLAPVSLLNGYAMAVAFAGLAIMATQGAIFLQLKTKGKIAAKSRVWAVSSSFATVVLLGLVVWLTITTQPHLLTNYRTYPLLWVLPLMMLGAFCLAGFLNYRGFPGKAFAFSSLGIGMTFATLGAALYPTLVPSTSVGSSLTIANTASSALTLKLMLGVTVIGLCLVVAYTIIVRRPFRGVIEEKDAY